MSVPVGSVLEGKVTGITSFGAFVQLKEGPTGLVHISEIADTYVRDVNDFLKVDDEVRVKVISVKDGKIGLSIKQASPEYSVSIAAGRRPSDRGPRRAARSSASFEEKISKFLKDSEDRLSDLNRNTESKRGGRGSRYYR
ncbi:MAG: RNA-binding protein S1 [Firmicutes bacterium]|nr:RNA-binding protein S1 [Bacillota bacterium]